MKENKKYITQNMINGEIREYKTEEQALLHSRKLNKIDHAEFRLYKLRGTIPAKCIGVLHRDFGKSDLYWRQP